MKKVFLLGLVCVYVLGLFLLAGCNKQGETEDTTTVGAVVNRPNDITTEVGAGLSRPNDMTTTVGAGLSRPNDMTTEDNGREDHASTTITQTNLSTNRQATTIAQTTDGGRLTTAPTTITTTELPTTTVTTTPAPVLVHDPNKPLSFPIFMYHTSKEEFPGGLYELYIKPTDFEAQIKYLVDNNYTFCTFDDWDNLFTIEKPVFITFDDGYESNYTEIFPILQKYNAKITLFLVVNNIEVEHLTIEMIQEMSESGLVKFESHTMSHASLSNISKNLNSLTYELEQSRIKIEEITGKKVTALAYPNGDFNSTVKQEAAKYYRFGLRKDLGMNNTDCEDFELHRYRIDRSTTMKTFIKFLG